MATKTLNHGNSERRPRPQLYIVDKKKKSRYQVHLKSLLVFLIVLALMIIERLFNGSYFDEVLGVISMGYLIVFNRKIKRYDLVTFALIIVTLVIGLVSNWYSGLNVSLWSIGVDAVTQVKVIAAFFAVKYFLNDKEKQATLDMFLPIGKLYCIAAFICSIITQFVDIGMTNDTRFGLNSFAFGYTYNFEYITTFLVFFAAFVCTDKLTPRQKGLYYFMTVVAIGLNLKSQALILTFMFVLLLFYFKRHDRLNPIVIIAIVCGILFLGQYQISTYLTHEGAARQVFNEYAVKTANNYFPFGSGFATYGSAEAAKNYSPLYTQYHFDKHWGMSRDFGPFLKDTHWASVLGQFGWIGAILMGIVYIRIFVSFTNSKSIRFDLKAFLYATFAQFVIHAIGSGIITSSSGMLGFVAIALASQVEVDKDVSIRLPKIKISF